MRILTIDPGISGTGWAVFSKQFVTPIAHGIIYPKEKEISKKFNYIVSYLQLIVKKMGVRQVYIEFPSYFQSAGGRVTAASGALVKLSNLVGAIMFALEAKPIKVAQWKGQLPKEVVIKRIKKILPNCKAKSHDWDAIGIGLYVLGRF